MLQNFKKLFLGILIYKLAAYVGSQSGKNCPFGPKHFFSWETSLEADSEKVCVLSKLENQKLHNRLCNFGPHLAQKTIFK